MDDNTTNIVPDFITDILSKEKGIIKKQQQDDNDNDNNNNLYPFNVVWKEQDIKALEEFCKLHSIIIDGFDCSNMMTNPISALAFLKNKLGIITENDDPIKDIKKPTGYEKLGKYNSNYSYTQMIKKKTSS